MARQGTIWDKMKTRLVHPVLRDDLEYDEKKLVGFIRRYNREAVELGCPQFTNLFMTDGHTYKEDAAGGDNRFGTGLRGAWDLYRTVYARDLKKTAKWQDPVLGISYVEPDYGMRTDLCERRSADVSKKHIGGLETELLPRSTVYLGNATRDETIAGTNVALDRPQP
jgi:hypothetical protein